MSKILLITILAIGIIAINAQLTPAQQTLQSFLNGVYQENNLADPTTIVECFDPTTAQNTVNFITQILPKFASASQFDLPSLGKQVEAFINTIPAAVKTCVENDQELLPLASKYGINSQTNWAALEAKIMSYVTLHFSTVHKELQTINSQWQSQQYQQAGTTVASFAHTVIGLSATQKKLTQLTPDQQNLQLFLNGLFTENKLPNPTTIINCIDPTTAQSIFQFIGQILPQAASGSISDLMNIVKECEAFGKTIPDSVSQCLSTNQEVATLESAYGISSSTNWAQLEAKIISYITFHFSAVHKSLQGINAQWQSGNYYQSGYQLAQFGHQLIGDTVISMKLKQSAAQVTLQQVFNGLFEENKLPDPTTVVQCFDPDTAQLLVNFIGQILPEAASASITNLIKIIKQVQDFGDQIPATVKTCLDNNAELVQLGNAYGINNDTSTAAIIAKITSYITFHYPALHKALSNINSLWTQQNYYQVGYQAGVLGHTVLGADETSMIKLSQTSPQTVLQQAFNGLFEENKLADPTTVVQCFTGDTAQQTVQFIASILGEAASGSVSDLINIVKQFQQFSDSLPQTVTDCLNSNTELIALGNAYGFTPNSDKNAIIAQVIKYITFHYPALHKSLGNINTQWVGANYYQAGYQAGDLGHQVFG